jgi:ABC-type sugar transport system permease subunit
MEQRAGVRSPWPSRRWVLWVLPALAVTALFTIYPIVESLRLSFHSWQGFGAEEFVGLANYQRLLADGVAHRALWNTFLFAVLTTLGTVVIGAAIALAIDRRVLIASVFKRLVFLPVILPVVFTGLVWVYGMDANFGWVNETLGFIHPSLQRAWLSDPGLVMYSIIAVTILQYSGFPMIIILAALQDIPAEIHEAATLDGVSEIQRARHVSLPLVRDVIATIVLLQLLFGFNVFDQVFVMTRGGPGSASEVMSYYVFRQAFDLQRFGLGAAAAVVTSVVVVAVAMIYLTAFRSRRISRAG